MEEDSVIPRRPISIHDGARILQAKLGSNSKEITADAMPKMDSDFKKYINYGNGYDAQDKNLSKKKKKKKKKKSPKLQRGESSKKQQDTATLTWEDSPYAHDTTLYKAVPFTRIPLDAEVNNLLESLKTNPELKEALECDPKEFEIITIAGIDYSPWATPAGPVLYVKSIAICNDKQDLDDFEMFGEISVADYKKNMFYLFSCEPDESHRVSTRKNLFISQCPMAPVTGGKVKFSLRNPPGTPQIFKEDKEFSLDYSHKDDCEEDMYQEFPLEGGYYAKMVFNKIPRAAFVRCLMFLNCTRPGCVGQFYKVHGSVKINNVVCVDRNNSSKALHMKYGEYDDYDQLFTRVFALQVGSPLKVEYKLYHDDFEFANGKYEVPPHYMQGGVEDEEYLTCKDENYYLGMSIHWYLHDSLFGRGRRFMDHVKVNAKMKWSTDITPQKSMQGTSDSDLVEVFSVFVGDVDSAPPVLCGRIVVRDAYGKFYIFARNKDFPDKYSSTKQQIERTVSLAWPDRWFANKDFYMHLRLKDANEELVCKGELSWQDGDSRFDRRLCDVITNEKGFFAVVHYSVFKNGKKAKVSVKHTEDVGYIHVYGRIFAAYDNNDDYPSTYDKECYRSIIFNRSEEDCVTVDNRFEIPLSKTHVSAPSDCKKLIVDADLWVRPNMNTSYQRATADLHFESSRDGSQSKQLGCLMVTVNWSQ